MRRIRWPKRGKVGKIPIKAAFRLNELLSIATARLLNNSLQCFKEAVGPIKAILLNDLNAQTSCSDPLRLHNEEQRHTLAFRYPRNGHFYIVLKMDSFNEYFCG